MASSPGRPSRRRSVRGVSANTASKRQKPSAENSANASERRRGASTRGSAQGNAPSAPRASSARVVPARASGRTRHSRLIRKGQSRAGLSPAPRAPKKNAPPPPPKNQALEDELLTDLPEAPEALAETVPVMKPAQRKKSSRRSTPPSRRRKDAREADEADEAGEERTSRAKIRAGSRSARRGPLSSRRGVPTASQRRRGKEEELEEDPASALSARRRRARRGEDEGEADPRASRRSRRVSMRESKPAGPLLSTKHKLIGAALVTLVIAAVVAYKPVRRKLLVGDLENGASLKAKQRAVKTLYQWLGAEALPIFASHLKDGDSEEVRGASAHGIALAVRGSGASRAEAIQYVKNVFQSDAGEVRLAMTEALVPVAGHFLEIKNKAGMAALAKVLGSRVGEESDPGARLAALQALAKLPAPGVCVRLLEVAQKEKDEPRSVALAGIPRTAMPGAVGALLKSMGNREDQALAEAARKGFAKVRNEADTKDLIPLLTHKNAEVRLEIVKALVSRRGDRQAVQAVVKSFADGAPQVRVEAVRAAPHLNLGTDELAQLGPRISDAKEEVRLVTAETFAALHDETSWKLLLGAFQKNLQGKTLAAFAKTLGLRGRQRNRKRQHKDRAALDVAMALLAQHPGVAKEALVQLTIEGGGPHREAQRKAWGAERWNKWYANLKTRDATAKKALKMLKDAAHHMDMKYQSQFKLWADKTVKALEMLEKCKAMCKPDDKEDAWIFDGHVRKYQAMHYHFEKFQVLHTR